MKLEYASPIYRSRQKRQQLMDAEQKLIQLMQNIISGERHQMELYIEKLEGLSPLRKLNSGYALVLNSQDKVMKRIAEVTVGEKIRICVTDGDVIAQVKEVIEKDRKTC
jgi:exodeoxyribonuclease VII large subunit